MTLMRDIIWCGTGAALASAGATMLLARVEGEPALRPLNATSHWLWGEEAGRARRADLAHTGIGGATNLAAGFWWGAVYAALLNRGGRVTRKRILRDAAATGALAGVLDYGLLPHRMSPGWEHALSGRAVVLSMAAMAVGLAAGALAARDAASEAPAPGFRSARAAAD